MFFDSTYPTIDFDSFNDGAEWKEFYDDVTENQSLTMPLIPEAEQLTFACGLTVTIQETKKPDFDIQDISSS